jgi:hypothetical protein
MSIQAYFACKLDLIKRDILRLRPERLRSLPAEDDYPAIACDPAGRPQDQAEATAWFRAAANDGDTAAQHNLGVRLKEVRCASYKA